MAIDCIQNNRWHQMWGKYLNLFLSITRDLWPHIRIYVINEHLWPQNIVVATFFATNFRSITDSDKSWVMCCRIFIFQKSMDLTNGGGGSVRAGRHVNQITYYLWYRSYTSTSNYHQKFVMHLEA